MSLVELESYGIKVNSNVELNFDSGIVLTGTVENILSLDGMNVIISFSGCLVSFGSKNLFMPEWGTYDLACSSSIDSVYSGASDIDQFYRYLDYYDAPTASAKFSSFENASQLDSCLKELRHIRENGLYSDKLLEEIYNNSINKGFNNWLVNMEIIELISNKDSSFAKILSSKIRALSNKKSDLGRSISRGIPIYFFTKQVN